MNAALAQAAQTYRASKELGVSQALRKEIKDAFMDIMKLLNDVLRPSESKPLRILQYSLPLPHGKAAGDRRRLPKATHSRKCVLPCSRQREQLHPSGLLKALLRRKGVPAVTAPVSVERSSAELPRTPIRQSEGYTNANPEWTLGPSSAGLCGGKPVVRQGQGGVSYL